MKRIAALAIVIVVMLWISALRLAKRETQRSVHDGAPNLRRRERGAGARRLLGRAAALAHHDWEDLHAAWQLQRGLWRRTELISRLIAFAGTRLINGAARKMPLPEPSWFDEVRRFDVDQSIREALLIDAWSIRKWAAERERNARNPFVRLRDLVRQPYDEASVNSYLAAMRLATSQVIATRKCDVD